MYSATTIGRTKRHLNISNAGPRFGSTKLAAGAPHIRAFCECAGACAIRGALTLAVLSALLLIAARPAQAQTEGAVGSKARKPSETVLYNFYYGSDGAYPISRLTSDGAGNFYGTTCSYEGQGPGYGTVFELSPNGSGGWNETVLYSFTGGADGSNPMYSDVIFDSVGNLYGTTEFGGANGYGVVFELSPAGTSWTETVLHSFAWTDGANPLTGVIMDPAGNLYGTTGYGGANGYGTVFEMSPSGGGWTEQVIYTLVYSSYTAGLTMDAAGNIFGVSLSTVFELSPNGSGGWNATVIQTFCSRLKDGCFAVGTPALDQAGNLYGMTADGGAKNYGTAYKLTPGENGKWTEKILHSFRSGKDGSHPWAGVVLDAAGNIYGTTLYGDEDDGGIVFELVAPVGTGKPYEEKILWSFTDMDGYWPHSSLILDSSGKLYGTTVFGGSNGVGVVFEVTP